MRFSPTDVVEIQVEIVRATLKQMQISTGKQTTWIDSAQIKDFVSSKTPAGPVIHSVFLTVWYAVEKGLI